MSPQTIEIYNVNLTLKIEKNKDGQALRILEIYSYDVITIVEIDVLGTIAVINRFGDGSTRFKNPFSSASKLQDVIIFVEEEDKKIPDGYDITFMTITISHRGKTTVVCKILARSNLDKPYLHELNLHGDIKVINIHKV